MSLTAAQYTEMLLALAPPGSALPSGDTTSTWYSLVAALARGLARLDGRADDLVEEADPRTTYELLEDWERVCGLPGDCSHLYVTVQERREAVELTVTALGGASAAYFEEVAATIGVEATVEEFPPFRADYSAAGDPVADHEDWAFTWRMRGPEVVVRPFRVGQGVAGERLRTWGHERFECEINRIAPAHTIVLFAYGDEEE